MGYTERRPRVVGMPFLHPDGRRILEEHCHVFESTNLRDLYARASDADALYAYRPFDIGADVFASCPNLKIVAVGGSGFDHVDLDAAQQAGVVVTRGGGLGALSVAEHAIGLMLAVSKRLAENDAYVRQGLSFVDRRRGELYDEISGLTLAIVGFGSIGRELARIAHRGFGMTVVAVNRSGHTDCPDVARSEPLHTALRSADIISVNTPLTEETRCLIGAHELAHCKQGALLVDTSRGGVVDAAALRDALLSGHLRGAGVDVFLPEPPPLDHPLLGLQNVVLSPHSAGFTRAASRRLSLFVAEDILRTLRGERPLGLIGPEGAWSGSRAVCSKQPDQFRS